MKPVSVTVGMSQDDEAIEACFALSMLSDLGKAEENEDPILSVENDPSVDQRDDGAQINNNESGSESGNEHSLREEKEGGREDTSTTSREQPGPTSSALSGSQSDDNFIEAEFEMVLENYENPTEQEKLAGQVVEPCVRAEVVDEEEEEKVVVWCADSAGTCSQSVDSEPEGIYPIEEEEPSLARESPNDSMGGSTGSNPSLSLSNNLVTGLTDESDESMLDPSAEWQSDEEMPTVDTSKEINTEPTEEATVPSLSALISQRQWHKVIERVQAIPTVTDVSIEDQVSSLGRDSLGDSFLHEICKNQPTVEVIRLWLERNKDDVKRHGIGGHLPLHYACAFGASVEVVELLAEACPKSLITPDEHDNMLPLHFACRQKTRTEVLDFLLEAHPETVFVQDTHGMTPMDYATSLQDPDIRDPTMKRIQATLKNNISALSDLLADSKTTLREEQGKVKDLSREARAEKEAKEKKAREDHSLLEYALNRVAVLEKTENEQKTMIESLEQKAKTMESQLSDTQHQLTAEKNRLYIEKTRELESTLKIEQCKISALEQSLVAKQEMWDNEKERTKDAEQKLSEMRIALQNEGLKTKRLGESLNVEKARLQRLEEDLAYNKTAGAIRKTQSDPPLGRIGAPTESEFDAENSELDRIHSETEAKLETNREAIQALELSSRRKKHLLDAQQEKVESLERSRREKESLLQKSQETMKALEESIERKLSLQKTEEGKIRQLDNLRLKKREMIESEEEQVRKLDYLLGRKQALLELEQMKEKTLQQTIAQKEALLESEMIKMKELEAVYAEKEALFFSEQDMVKGIRALKKEKEGLLRTENELVNKLKHVHSEKETLLKMKQRLQEDIATRVRAAEDALAEEKRLLEATEKVRAEKESLLLQTDETLKTIEARTSKKSSLMIKEKSIAESLEKFQQRRSDVARQGRLYYLVDTTLSISHLVKEALLGKKYDMRLIEEQKPKARVVMKKNILNSDTLLRKAFSVKGKRGYFHHVAGYFGIAPSWRKYAR